MTPARYQKIKNIVMEALEKPVDERGEYLDEVCLNNSDLRQEVEGLLNLQVGDSFLAASPLHINTAFEQNQEQASSDRLEGRIGRIRISHLLAKGGMGEVYSGVDDLLERPVAIKVVSSGLRMSKSRRAAFLNEARVLSNLHHPNICQVYDFFEDRGRDVLVMELINGDTLRSLIKQHRPDQPLQIARQVAKALVAAHERGIAHRDLKPENVMLTTDGQVKVLDFGLAGTETASGAQASGTPGYLSPEQANGENSTTATDLWSFGLLLGELLSGKLPYADNTSPVELVERARNARVTIPANLPGDETALIRDLLARDPGSRPSARDTLERIDRIIARPRRRLVVAGLAALILISVFSAWKYTADLKYERQLALEAQHVAEQARSKAEDLVGFMLEDLYEGLVKVGRLELMESVADRALDYYGDLSPAEMGRSGGQPAIALQRVAEINDFQGDLSLAIKIMQQSLAGLQNLVEREPNNDLALYRLGSAHSYLADLYRTGGQFSLAREHSQTAMEIGSVLTEGLEPGHGPDTRPTAEQRWRVLLRSTYIHADTYMREGDHKNSVSFLEQAVALAVPAVAQEPALSTDLGDIQFKRCDAYYDMALDDLALTACNATLKLDQQIHLANPENYTAHKNYALDHTVLARVYRSLGQHDAGLQSVDAGLQHLTQLLAWEPNNTTRQNDFVTGIITKGQLLHDMGDMTASGALFEQAYTSVESMSGLRKDIPFLNNSFITFLFVGEVQKARVVASQLSALGFRRREFREMCQQFDITECDLVNPK